MATYCCMFFSQLCFDKILSRLDLDPTSAGAFSETTGQKDTAKDKRRRKRIVTVQHIHKE